MRLQSRTHGHGARRRPPALRHGRDNRARHVSLTHHLALRFYHAAKVTSTCNATFALIMELLELQDPTKDKEGGDTFETAFACLFATHSYQKVLELVFVLFKEPMVLCMEALGGCRSDLALDGPSPQTFTVKSQPGRPSSQLTVPYVTTPAATADLAILLTLVGSMAPYVLPPGIPGPIATPPPPRPVLADKANLLSLRPSPPTLQQIPSHPPISSLESKDSQIISRHPTGRVPLQWRKQQDRGENLRSQNVGPCTNRCHERTMLIPGPKISTRAPERRYKPY
ncbi:hypothetical protein C8R46DRAFT_514558 [Mycena filopes]|nr:hypothetical protein C8R46DRAFT_514558 [Mycena filopes]